MELDARHLQRMRIAEQPGLLRTLAVILAHSGNSWFWLAGLGLVWWFGSDYWKQLALTLIIAILLTAGVVFLVKFTVRRRRPEGEWGKFYRSTDPHSFPSGHAVRAVMLAVVTLGLGPLWLGVIAANLGSTGRAGARRHGGALSVRRAGRDGIGFGDRGCGLADRLSKASYPYNFRWTMLSSRTCSAAW